MYLLKLYFFLQLVNGCCSQFVLMPSLLPSYPKTDVAAALSAFPLPWCLCLFMVYVLAQTLIPSDQGQAVLIAPFPGIQAAGKLREKQCKMHLFCAGKIDLPLFAGTKWLLLMKSSGKSNPGPFFNLLQSPAHFRHCINHYNFFHIATLSASILWAVFSVLCFPPAGSSFSGNGCLSSFPGHGYASQCINPLLFPLCQLPVKFQINFNASLHFKAYKKTSVLPTLVSWDLFRNLEDGVVVVLGVSISSACIQLLSGWGWGHAPCPMLCWVGWSQQGWSWASCPLLALN